MDDQYKERSMVDGLAMLIIIVLVFAFLATGMVRQEVNQVGAVLRSAPPLVQVQRAAPPAPSWAQGAYIQDTAPVQVAPPAYTGSRAPGAVGCPADAPYMTLAGVCTP